MRENVALREAIWVQIAPKWYLGQCHRSLLAPTKFLCLPVFDEKFLAARRARKPRGQDNLNL